MCTCPNYMIPVATHVDRDLNEKPTYKFLGHHLFKKMIKTLGDHYPFVQVPCGKCLECRIQYARVWADRCVLEAKKYKDNYFVTLTYDDFFLPNRNSLEPKDLQLFIKRLRKYYSNKHPGIKIRFLASGEYGDRSWRPHYHIILFNCPIDDLSYTFERKEVVDIDVCTGKPIFGPYIKTNLEGNKKDMLFSKTIYELWHCQGNISVQQFNYDTAAYVSQYVTKKCKTDYSKIYDELKIYPEFLRMSNRPGIGADYFYDHDDGSMFLHKIIIPQEGEAHLSATPRYFEKLFVKKYGEDVFTPVRIKRLKDKAQKIDTLLNSDVDVEQQNKLKEYNLKKIHHLRNGI